MSSPSLRRPLLRTVVAVALTCAAALPAVGAPGSVLPFDRATWTALGRAPAQASIVVFSTTDCAHCPHAIDSIARTLRSGRGRARLAVVVMDGAGHEKELLASRHYRQANSLYVFADDAAALRFSVNPDWRGLTPYVALVPAGGTPRFFAGTPSPDVLDAFLGNPGSKQ